MQHSIIEYYSENEAYRCGYCKGRDTNYGHGLWAHTMTVTDYQDLIDRGWRRSGKYIYKPTLDLMCCPSYTIRCRALEFKISKSQKKVLKQFNKYLMGQDGMQLSGQGDQHMSSSCEDIRVEDYTEGAEQFVETTRAHQDIDLANIASQNSGEKLDDHKDTSLRFNTSDKEESVPGSTIHESKKAPGADPTKPPCKKAKQLRREKKLEKLKQKGIELTSLPTIIRNKEKQVEDFINELPQDCKHKLEIKLVRTTPPSPEWLATAKETHGVYVKYQTVIHGDKPEKCSEPKFKEFLVTSPLLMEHSDGGPSCGYGSFHQQYWLDGKIIAVGVIDILPKCVSSVYFFYDPQYMNLTLGTYGALREIEFTRHLHLSCPDLKYYYMGFYIHSCRKMRYKGNYSPSDLLCPETYKWFPIKDSITKLDNTPYSRLDPDVDSVDDNYPKESDIDYIPVLYKGQVMMYRLYSKNRGKASETASMMMEYARLVGAKTAKSLVMVT